MFARYENMFARYENMFARHENMFAGHENMFARHENMFAGHENMFARHENMFAGHENMFARYENMFARHENMFAHIPDKLCRDIHCGAILTGNRHCQTQLYPVPRCRAYYHHNTSSFITASASVVTASATGSKTLSSVISMDTGKTKSFKTIAEYAHESGMKIGVISSVNLDATPAGFFAKVPSWSSYYDSAIQMTQSGFEYFYVYRCP
jgi:alkaline phosphatase